MTNIGIYKVNGKLKVLYPASLAPGIDLALELARVAGANPYKIVDDANLGDRKYWTWSGSAEDGVGVDLTSAKAEKVAQANTYYESDAVRNFTVTVNGSPKETWSNRADTRSLFVDRSVDMRRRQLAGLVGSPSYTYTFNDGSTITLNISKVQELVGFMIDTRQANITAMITHKVAINALTTIEAIEAYDFTSGYTVNQSISLT